MRKIIYFLLVLSAAVFVYTMAYAASVTLSWTAPVSHYNDPNSGACDRYDLRYATATITEANFASATQLITGAPKTPGATENYSYTLPDKVHYYFAVKSYNVGNSDSAISNIAQKNLLPPAAVSDLR